MSSKLQLAMRNTDSQEYKKLKQSGSLGTMYKGKSVSSKRIQFLQEIVSQEIQKNIEKVISTGFVSNTEKANSTDFTSNIERLKELGADEEKIKNLELQFKIRVNEVFLKKTKDVLRILKEHLYISYGIPTILNQAKIDGVDEDIINDFKEKYEKCLGKANLTYSRYGIEKFLDGDFSIDIPQLLELARKYGADNHMCDYIQNYYEKNLYKAYLKEAKKTLENYKLYISPEKPPHLVGVWNDKTDFRGGLIDSLELAKQMGADIIECDSLKEEFDKAESEYKLSVPINAVESYKTKEVYIYLRDDSYYNALYKVENAGLDIQEQNSLIEELNESRINKLLNKAEKEFELKENTGYDNNNFSKWLKLAINNGADKEKCIELERRYNSLGDLGVV